jgi:hypothetical protein
MKNMLKLHNAKLKQGYQRYIGIELVCASCHVAIALVPNLRHLNLAIGHTVRTALAWPHIAKPTGNDLGPHGTLHELQKTKLVQTRKR